MHRLLHVPVTPAIIATAILQQVALNPTLRRLSAQVVSNKSSFEDGPQDARKAVATKAMCKACRFDRCPIIIRSLPFAGAIFDQTLTIAAWSK
jgi:hypothetical protein